MKKSLSLLWILVAVICIIVGLIIPFVTIDYRYNKYLKDAEGRQYTITGDYNTPNSSILDSLRLVGNSTVKAYYEDLASMNREDVKQAVLCFMDVISVKDMDNMAVEAVENDIIDINCHIMMSQDMEVEPDTMTNSKGLDGFDKKSGASNKSMSAVVWVAGVDTEEYFYHLVIDDETQKVISFTVFSDSYVSTQFPLNMKSINTDSLFKDIASYLGVEFVESSFNGENEYSVRFRYKEEDLDVAVGVGEHSVVFNH